MEKASRDLIHEHDAILITLSILEKICSLLKSPNKTNFNDIEQIIDFIKVFADRCHHGKEEIFFIPALEEAGIEKKNGPLDEVLMEHALGRELVRGMQKSVSCNFFQADKFIKSSTLYIDLLRNHIEKENTILFPLADSILTDAKQTELLKNFEIFEDAVISKGKHNELHHILESFENKYLK